MDAPVNDRAVVISHPGRADVLERVIASTQNAIAHFKIPQHVRIVDSFPMTVTGKIQKFRIRQTEIEALGLEGQIAATA